MEKRKRNIQIKFRVTEEEKQLIEQKMAAATDTTDRRVFTENGD